MILEALVLLLAAEPAGDNPPPAPGQFASDNEVVNGQPAIATFACNAGNIEFQLYWPAVLENDSVKVSLGSGGEMDAAMGSAKIWKTATRAGRQAVVAPFPPLQVVSATDAGDYLLVQVNAPPAAGIAQFNAAAVKAAFDQAEATCPSAPSMHPDD